VLNPAAGHADEDGVRGETTLEPDVRAGMIIIGPRGDVRVLRSRRPDGDWNCSDGAPVTDAELHDGVSWSLYTPERLLEDLRLAGELRVLGEQRELQGGIATWDACSGRPCVLPKLAKLLT
jgi:hypothetical protein